jgi:DNA-directed RNA polymerase specialized sigma24 family protein
MERSAGPEQYPDFDSAVAQLLETVTAGERGSQSSDVGTITTALSRFLHARFPRLDDPEDVAAESVARFIEAAGAGSVDPGRRPAAYITRIAQHAAIDRLRRTGRLQPLDDASETGDSDDEAIVRLLDRDATGRLVSDAIGAANDAGDHVVVQIITYWLDLARCDQAPSSRVVARRAGVSHWTVNQALQRFRNYLPESGPNP